MSESKGALKVILPIVLVTGGAAYWFFGIHQPGKEKDAAQAEIDAWGKQWADARACLLGAEPASSDLRVALAARQLLPDPWDTGSCATKLGALTRKAGVDTGLAAVERAWTRQDLAVISLAKAFGDWVVSSKAGDLPVAATGVKEDKLPVALDELAASYAFLRESAGMAPPPKLTTKEAPTATLIPLKLGTEPLVGLAGDELLRDGLAYANVKSGYAQIVLHPGGAAEVTASESGVLRSVSGSWGATSTDTGVIAGPLDERGAVPATGATVALPGNGQVLGVVGDGNDGLIAYRTAEALHIIHAKAGALTADPPIPNYGVTVMPDLAGKSLAIELVDPAQASFVARATNGAPLAFTPLASSLMTYEDGCVSKSKVWRTDGVSVIAYDATGAAAKWAPPKIVDIVGCSPQGLVVALRDGRTFAACSDDAPLGPNPQANRKPALVPTPPSEPAPITAELACRTITVEGPQHYTYTAIAGSSPVVVGVRDRAVAVWREGAAVQLFALPERIYPAAVHATDKVIDILGSLDAKDDNRPLAIARLALP